MIKRTREGKMYIQTKRISILEDINGELTYFVPIPPMSEAVKGMSTPVLEDWFAEINMELQERDRKEIEDSLGR